MAKSALGSRAAHPGSVSVTAGPLCGAAHCSAQGIETVADPFKANPNPPLKTEHKHHAARRANWRLVFYGKRKDLL